MDRIGLAFVRKTEAESNEKERFGLRLASPSRDPPRETPERQDALLCATTRNIHQKR